MPGLEASGRRRPAAGAQRRLADPPPARPGRRALLPARRQGGRPRALRRPRRRHPGRLDRLQPRQPGADPRLGGGGLRGQLHRPAHAHGAGAGRRARRRALGHQRGRPRPGRRRARRRARRASWRAAPRWRSASATASGAWPSYPARTSTAGSATSSAAWLTSSRCSESTSWRRSSALEHREQLLLGRHQRPALLGDPRAPARRSPRARRRAGRRGCAAGRPTRRLEVVDDRDHRRAVDRIRAQSTAGRGVPRRRSPSGSRSA